MASAVYPKALEAFLSGLIDLLNDDIRCVLVDTADYTYDAAHDFLADVAAGARVSTSAAMTGKSVTDGVFDADDVTLPGATGDQSEAVIIYQHTGNDATARLIVFIDQATSGLPVLPNGGDILLQWSNSASRIFKLGA